MAGTLHILPLAHCQLLQLKKKGFMQRCQWAMMPVPSEQLCTNPDRVQGNKFALASFLRMPHGIKFGNVLSLGNGRGFLNSCICQYNCQQNLPFNK